MKFWYVSTRSLGAAKGCDAVVDIVIGYAPQVDLNIWLSLMMFRHVSSRLQNIAKGSDVVVVLIVFQVPQVD